MELITRHIVPLEYSAGYLVETITFNRSDKKCYVGICSSDTTWLREMGFTYVEKSEPCWRKTWKDGFELIVRVFS